MGYSTEAVTDSCYDGTTCLINKFNIKDETKLAGLDASISFAKGSEWIKLPLCSSFDFEHYKLINRFLFEDLYEWAGTVRKINISKKGTSFADFEDLEKIGTELFKRCAEIRLMNKKEFCKEIADFYCDVNLLHPFREGNGRTQRIFFTQFINSCGYKFSFTNIDTDLLMVATIQAANGVKDMIYSIFDELIME